MIYVYIAAPYSHIEPVIDVRTIHNAAEKLWAAGMVPFVPDLSIFVQRPFPPIELWYERQKVWIERCDILLRLPGNSHGADMEVAAARERGMTVWFDLDALLGAYKRDEERG